MLQLSGSLIKQPVLSLRNGATIATTLAPLINPNNLKVEGFFCQEPGSKERLIVLYQDIRDVIPQGVVVNDREALTHPSELIRLKDIIDLNFVLDGKPVVTASNEKLGKVNDYAVEVTTMYVQKLYVGQSLLKNFSGGSLSIERTQIIEITNRKIVIQDPLQPTQAAVPATQVAG